MLFFRYTAFVPYETEISDSVTYPGSLPEIFRGFTQFIQVIAGVVP
jgi:hypothetical protein